ncbi:ankyrin-3 isoform X25 [Frankliniella occidentalis]|uniref:Ankyrin-3 isoform X25 n=1 Tax=Frankliniella occidentalis TaxID=133901 RepID=A0A9C6U1Z7_FRAOC|nr:ankyrin-3 isoform X25 [Frankliniella occidentalis]
MAQFVTSLQPSLADMSRTPHAGHPPHPHPPPHKGHGHEKEKEKIAQKMAKEQQQLQQQQQQAHSKHAAQAAAAASVPERVAEKSDGNTAFLRAARAGNLDKVLEHLKSDVDINTANANGLNALHLASKEGHTHVVTELLSRGATVDASTKKGNTALHIASLAGQEEVVRLLVQHGAAVNVQSQNGFTPLYMAAQENHDNVVKFLLANGANQSLATEDGFTPLAVAMQQGHDKVVAVLLENDTRGKVRLPALHIAAKKDDCKAAALLLQNEHNPDVTSKSGFTPLHIAAHYGNEAIANLLLNKGADVNYSAKHNISPLHVAAKWGKTNLVALLLERGAHIEAKTRDGLTPLHCAARSGHEQVVDMMLERGAPISCKTKNGLAPLHMAAQGDHVDAARILLYHRAPVDEITVDYLTALHVAAHCGHVRVAKLLLDRKADPNARALNGFTPLHIACKKNRIKVVELLLKHGASIEATTESGLTPLHVASFMGCMNIVIYLLQNEANPDVPTVRGETPLHLAARANQTDIIRILLRNGAQVDARAREQQTPLHIASRLGNVDIVMLLLQHGAAVDSTTKDLYTALHIAAKEGQEEVAAVLLENGASLTATTNKGCTPLHLAAKYGNMKVAKLLLQKDAPVDSQGKNGVTPLHVASHYDHQSVALLLLDKGASPHATAKNGHTPLHIAARKNQMDIATTLLEYGAKANAESRAGFTPLHLSAQEGHTDMSTLLIEHQADTNHQAKNGLTPLHLCAQEDRVNVAQILVKSGANVDSITKAGYTPLHVASHFGQVNMVRFLLQHGADTGAVTSVGYTPLHQAAQQGHSGVVSILLNSGAQPNVTTKQGQTALSIAQKLGYISVVETLKVVTEITTITTTTTTTIEEKYRVVAPETMQETFMSDSEEEGGDQGLECTGMYFGKPTHAQHVYLPYYEGQSLLKREDTLLNEQPYHYLTVDEMKSLGDDSLPIDVTQDDRHDSNRDLVSPQHVKEVYSAQLNYASDNVDISRHPVNVGKLKWKNFLVSFLVDARGGAMRGCRHSGVRVIVPPRKAPQPLRVTCRYLKRDKLSHPPPLMEGEALASRILELGPVGAKFLGPVIIEVPHFGSLRGREREIVILRSDNGETWREHTVEASEDAIHDVLNESFEKDGERNELSQLEVCDSGRLTRILTTDFPQYFAVVSRVRQEVHAIGPEGGMVSSSVVPQVQAVFPQGALTKKIKVGLQAQPIQADLVAKLLGNRVAVSPIVTVEPRRRKFHKPITLTIPVPQAANKGMINQYSGDAPTLRLLCSITGGTTRAQWEDVTGSTPLTFVNDCVSFTTTVSARFWLMDCRNISEATRMATELYKEAIHVPFLAKFVVFSKRVDFLEARLRVFCMTDDKEDKTLEHQEHFTEVAKSRDVEVLEGKSQFVEFAGNLVPVTKSGDQLQLGFRGFRENRLAFTTRVKDPHADAVGRILFMKEAKVQKGDPPQQPVCVLNIVLPDDIIPESSTAESTPQKYSHVHLSINGSSAPARPELRLSDISNTLGSDWESLAVELGLSRSDVDRIKSDHPASAAPQHAMAMLRLWLQKLGNKASGTELQQALQRLGRDDIIHRCMISCDDQEMNLTSSHLGLDQSGFDNLQEELGVSRDVSRDASREASLRRNLSLEAGGPYDEQDIMKVSRDSESVEELVEKPIHTIERIEEVKQIDKHHREQDDSEERKYVAEEKEVEEKRKSVRERTQDIEKRLSQTSMEDQQQRRDSQLFQGVSEGLERLNVTQATEAGGEHNWHESKVSTTTTITSEQHSGSQDRDHSSDVASPQLEGISAYSTEMNHPAHYNVKPEPDALQPNDINHDSAFKSSNNSPVLEEMFTKTLAPGYHKALDQKADEVDKKKDKKEREREEKERKKREKKEKEQREKEEKEKREREKKEKKEKDKRDKEERQKREKEEKKNKSLKEKADREQMEKEAAKTEELKRVTPDSEKKEVTSDEITLVGGTDTSDNVVISKWQADELLDNGKENGTVPLPTFRNVKETGNDRNTTENLSASPTIPEYMRDSVFSELLTQEIEEPLTSSKFEILPGPEDGATFVKSNLKEERNFSAPLPETLTGEYDKNIHNTVTRETLNLSRASDQDSFAVGIASGGPSLPADRDAVTSISPNLEDLVPRKSDTGPHTSEFVGAYTMSGIENDNLQIGTKIDFGISGSFSNQTNVQLKCDKPSGSVHDTHDQLKDNAEKMTGIINLPHVPSESAQCTFGEELKPVCTFNETSRVKIDIDGHQKSLSGKATSIEGDSSVSTLRTAVTHGSQPLDVVKSEPIDLVQKRDSLDNNFLPFSSSDYANQRAGADMQGPILGDQSEVNINLHVAESKDDKNHLTAAALDNTSEERSKRESAGATINFSENPSDYILDLPLLDEEFLRNTPMVSVVTEQAGAIAEPEPLTSKETAQDVCYVTTPTMQRRAHSQRRSREDRPPPVDVSYLGDDDSDGEEYIVTEPTDEGHMPEDRFRINSSPEILNVTYSNKEGQRRSHDQNRVKFQLGSLDSQDSISSDPNTPITPVTKLHKFTVEKVEEEKAASETCDFAATAPTENASKRKETLDDSSKRLRRVDRHFERMASQSLAEGTTPVREFDYQRVLSKLSHDDVAASEDEYENLLHEAATPSDEWDSSGGTDNSPEALKAALLRSTEVPVRSPIPTFLFSQSSEDRDVFVDSDEDPTPPPVPTSVFWCFDDRPMRASSLSLDELGLPLSESTTGGMGATEGTNPSAAPTSALPRRPPPSHDISVDDEPEFDVREHDWRFNLQHSAEAPEEEEVSSAEEKQ